MTYRRIPRLSAVALAIVMSSSCGDGLGPITMVTPQIESLALSGYSFGPPAGIVAISARLTDTSVRLRPNTRIPVHVTVAGGDEETMGLEHRICVRGGNPTVCSSVSVGVKAGHTRAELGTVLGGIWARWWITFGSRDGGLWVFDSRDVPGAILALRRHPAVAYAEYDGIGGVGVGPSPPMPSYPGPELIAAVPLDYATAKPNDGKVQGQHGALMTVRYTQPDGSELTQTFAIP